MKSQHVIIIGSGVAGLATSLFLKRLGWKVRFMKAGQMKN